MTDWLGGRGKEASRAARRFDRTLNYYPFSLRRRSSSSSRQTIWFSSIALPTLPTIDPRAAASEVEISPSAAAFSKALFAPTRSAAFSIGGRDTRVGMIGSTLARSDDIAFLSAIAIEYR